MMRDHVRRLPQFACVTAFAIAWAGCGRGQEPSAYGTFEAEEVQVAAETAGRIVDFRAREGEALPAGAIAAVIDTTQLALERQQILAQRNATGSRRTEATEQLRVLEVQREIAQRAWERTRRLHAEQAATTQQLEQAERELRTLTAQMEAVRAQRQSVGLDVAAGDARLAQIADRIAKSVVRNPSAGTVLAAYVRPGELVGPGQPLYRVADLDTLVLRAYVTGAQLSGIVLGQPVDVHVDRDGGDLLRRQGTLTWISSTAEFTPTPIQTRDERADLVYAVKVRVPNGDGALKIGMPGDVTFPARSEPRS